jgi:MmeI, helicase spacer domain/MmeI, N-terminal domain/MmeI, DNA-methyltransferase domain
MTPEQFIAKWRGATRTERSAAQEHFLDLCALLEVPKPADVDRHGTEYTFEKSTRKIGGTAGFADVWKRHCFAWEYKGKRSNLVQAYQQLKQYADAFENPPLLIVSDMQEIRVHTNFTNAIAQQHVIPLAELPSVEARALLRNCFLYPERLLPTQTRESVTAQAAARFANIAVLLRQHFDERRVAHFINKLVFCLFAEDIELLPDRIFADILDESVKRPDDFAPMLRDLFGAMANRNGRFGKAAIPWFNGGLFDDDDVLPLGIVAVQDLMTAARLDWKAIDPTIFGTLFESGLDDKKRAEMASLVDAPDSEDLAQARLFTAPAADPGVGIHYTDEATIMKIIEPVVVTPLRREWKRTKAEISEVEERRRRAHTPAEKTKLLAKARGLYRDFRTSLGRYRVLDPACGSGNFLALSLRALKDFDMAVLDDAAAMGFPPDNFRVGPEAVMGIEINSYAAELGPPDGLDHRAAVAVAQGLGAYAPADPRQTGQDYAGGRSDHAKRRRQRVAGSGCGGRQPAVPRRQADAQIARRRLCRPAVYRLCGARAGGSRSSSVLVRQSLGADARGTAEARGPGGNQFDAGRCQSAGARPHRQERQNLRCLG